MYLLSLFRMRFLIMFLLSRQFTSGQDSEKCFFEVNRVLKNGGTFPICNESDGTNATDEKWTKLIDGMKIYTSEQLVAALKEAGFKRDKNVFKYKKSFDKYCCDEIANSQFLKLRNRYLSFIRKKETFVKTSI